ncbi:hypothetical protein MTQ00_16920 [Chryseobacterium sp. B21-037]|uniref:hypothetical protein n=1 Tax=Chryseobacterium sp. B21-037 TaxID=2926038 RepID=UPI002358E022|nr:hypothetical protein [Chryseobacterium sp. B21-037]MDC8106206.1 hypothetical protein [Chryseobacterium sp. B21-037]
MNKPPFFADLPFYFQGDDLKIDALVLDELKKNSTSELVFTQYENIKKLKAIKFDWGRNDELKHIPPSCMSLSKKS